MNFKDARGLRKTNNQFSFALLIFPLAARDGCRFATSSPTVTPPPLTPTRLLHIFGMLIDSTGYPGEKMINPWLPLLDLPHMPCKNFGKSRGHNFMALPLSQDRVGTC